MKLCRKVFIAHFTLKLNYNGVFMTQNYHLLIFLGSRLLFTHPCDHINVSRLQLLWIKARNKWNLWIHDIKLSLAS